MTVKQAALTTPTAPIKFAATPSIVPVATFLYGVPASGKSKVTDPLEAQGVLCISADKFCTKEDILDPSARHEERKHLARLQHVEALKNGQTFLLEGLGGHAAGMAAKIEEARAYGFAVRVSLVWCDWRLNFERNNRRERTLAKKVLVEALREVGPSWASTFSLAHTWETVCTNPGGNPFWTP